MSLARRWRLRQHSDFWLPLALTAIVIASVVANAVRDDQPFALLLIAGVIGAVLLRRSHPRAALLLAVAAQGITPGNGALLLPPMLVLYAIAVRAQWRPAAAAAAGAAALALIAGATWGSTGVTGRGGLLGYSIGSTACYAAAVAVGLYVGARRRVLDSLRERADRLDRERELLADRAVAQERIRIAQELHDIVAHNVSLMVVKAQALGATSHDQSVTESTDAIADLGRQAMTEMHITLRLLRDDGETPELSPQPRLAQLERLLEQLRGAGLDVELTVEGQPRQLAQGIDLSAFRIIQEALTNVVKHAAGASTKVTLTYHEQGIELTVVDTEDRVRAMVMQAPSEGHGVIGMRERAALFGGTLITEAAPHGFRVRATLPYTPDAS